MQHLTYTKKVVLGLAVGANILGLATLARLNITDSSQYSAAVVASTKPPQSNKCTVSLEPIELDPTYIAETLRDRKFTPQNMPFSVVDKFIVRTKLNCVRDTSVANNLSERLPLIVSITTTNSAGSEITLFSRPWTFGPSALVSGQDMFFNFWVGDFVSYLNRAGLSASETATNKTNLEILIDSIAKKRPVKVKLANDTTNTAYSYPATFPEPEKPVAMTNCYQAYGSGTNNYVIMMRALLANPYTIRPSQLLADITDIKNDFLTHSPLTQNIAKFSFYADLKQIDEGVELAQGISPSTPKKDILGKVLSNISRASSCGSEGTHVLRSTLPGQILVAGGGNFDGFTNGGGNIIIDTESGTSGLVLHEFGHSFGYLNDEYQNNLPAGVSIKKTNCSQNPSSDYKNGGQLYGATNLQGCTTPSLFRPSNNSLMNNPHGPEFNTVSCGYMLSRLKGGSPKSNFPACNIMTGIIHYP